MYNAHITIDNITHICYYNEYKSGIPKAPVYGFRLRITLDETGERKDYFRFCVLASEEMNQIVV